MAYSRDLRERVVLFVNNGGSKSEASKRYNVHRQTVYNWFQLGSDLSPRYKGRKTRKSLDFKL